jgi:predicted MFS family arabinose efflux permease
VRLDRLDSDRDFLRFWSAATVSIFGTLITRTALPFAAILVLGATPFQIGLLRLAELLPGFLIGIAAGAWLDRRRRKPVMIAADLVRAAVLLSVPLAAVLGWLSLPQLMLVAALMSLLNVAFDVATLSYLPTLVPRDRLVKANSRLSAASSVAETASFGLGGWLVQVLTAPIAILLDAATFIVSAVLLRGIDVPEPDPAENRDASDERGLLSEAADGLRLVVRDPVLRALTAANAGLSLSFGIGGAAFLIYVNQVLGFSPGVLGMIFAMGGVASLAGAIIAGRITTLPLGPVLIGCFLLAAIGQSFVPLATSAGLVGVTLLVAQQFVSDPAYTIFDINQVSLRQGIVSDELLGRVNATIRVTDVGAQMIGAVAGGIIGDLLGARVALWAGIVPLGIAGLWLLLSPIRTMRRLPTTIVEATP